MARINLLPWREERRERRKREFFTRLFLAGVAAVVVVLLWGFGMGLRIHSQNNRNTYLKGQIQQLDAQIAEIKNYKKQKDRLLARKKIVEKLQSSRSQMVHLFDQIVKTIPAGARLTGMDQKGTKLTLHGVAQSNATVARYMRNIEASPWMGPAKLIRTRIVNSTSDTPYEFELVVTLGTPNRNQNGGQPAPGGSAAVPVAAATLAPGAIATTQVPVAQATARSSAVTTADAAPAVSGSRVSRRSAAVTTSAPAATSKSTPVAMAAPAASGKPALVPSAPIAGAPATRKTAGHTRSVSAGTGGPKS